MQIIPQVSADTKAAEAACINLANFMRFIQYAKHDITHVRPHRVQAWLFCFPLLLLGSYADISIFVRYMYLLWASIRCKKLWVRWWRRFWWMLMLPFIAIDYVADSNLAIASQSRR